MKITLENFIPLLVVLFATIIFSIIGVYWLSVLVLLFGIWSFTIMQEKEVKVKTFIINYKNGEVDVIQAYNWNDVRNNKITFSQLMNIKSFKELN